MSNSLYQTPFNDRYSSREMSYIFSNDYKYLTWRQLWIWLAVAQKDLGLKVINEEQINQMEKAKAKIDYTAVLKYELELKHDVMAHLYHFADLAPKAKPIIHLGATSAYVTDNTDLIQIKKGLELLKSRIAKVIKNLNNFAIEHAKLATLSYTHFQVAQTTTVGKRATLWINSLLIDLESINHELATLQFRGAKGTTGTQATYLELFEGDYEKVFALDQKIAKLAGFSKNQAVSGQTYDRKQDSKVLNTLSEIAQSVHKITNDIRLLQHLKEIEEPFGKKQIGSSAMAYKQNPIKCERAASLAKFVISNATNAALVSSTQWLERTLDDSANRRLSIAQGFLAIDAVLVLMDQITSNLVVNKPIIKNHLENEIPFMITEKIIMKAVQKGQDRQEIHEIIRNLSIQVATKMKNEVTPNNLIELIALNDQINLNNEELIELCNPQSLIGASVEQTTQLVKKANAAIKEIEIINATLNDL